MNSSISNVLLIVAIFQLGEVASGEYSGQAHAAFCEASQAKSLIQVPAHLRSGTLFSGDDKDGVSRRAAAGDDGVSRAKTMLNSTVTSGMLLDVKIGRFIYSTQGPEAPPAWLCSVGARSDTQVIYASYTAKLDTTCAGITRTIYIPNTTWAIGRNRLYSEALRLEEEQGWRAEYLIFTDDDVELHAENQTADPYSVLHAALGNVQPAVASVAFKGWCEDRNRCGPRAPCAPDIDAAFNAFHATAHPMLLPYDAHFEDRTESASQAILITLLLASLPQHVVQFNHLFVTNAEHNRAAEDPSVAALWDPWPQGEVAKYLRGRVDECLREQIGLKGFGAGTDCQSCQISAACEDSNICSSNNANPGKTVNYMDIVKCKPYGN